MIDFDFMSILITKFGQSLSLGSITILNNIDQQLEQPNR